jgi:hypothetical protein
MEWIIVIYPESRNVFMDDEWIGFTNTLLAAGEGTHNFYLDSPQDYVPANQMLDVSATTAGFPLKITFSKAPTT